jgi:hypothetical protein
MLTFSSTLRLAVAVIGAVGLPSLMPAGAAAAKAVVGFEYGPPMSVAPTFGGHSGLRAAMDPAGETTLAWDYNTGEGHSLQLTTLAPGAIETAPATTLAGSRYLLSAPQLALAGDGRAAVAWLEERESVQVWSREALAVRVRDRLPDGTWAAPDLLWHAAPHSRHGIESLAVAIDQAGDEVVAWRARRESKSSPRSWMVMVATRPAGGTFTAPAAIAHDATGPGPAVAVNDEGEVTVLWCAPEERARVRAMTWPAGGSPPSASALLDQASGAEEQLHTGGFSDLAIEVGGNDAELATWLRGPSEASRPEPVALRAAWREPGAAFGAAYTVTAPGVDAREPAVAFPAGGSALIAWSQLNADGSGPDLDYAAGAAGATLSAAGVTPVSLAQKQVQPQAGWIQDGSAVLLWRDGADVLADRFVPGSPLGPPTTIGHLTSSEEPSEELQLAANGTSTPVLAWIGRSPADSAGEAVRYLPAGGLSGNPQPPEPVASLIGSRRLARAQGVTVGAECPEACRLTATGDLFGLREENAEEAAGTSYRPLGALRTASSSLAAGERKLIDLRTPRETLKAFCRSSRRGDRYAVEVRITIRLAGGVERHLTLGDSPTGRACR